MKFRKCQNVLGSVGVGGKIFWIGGGGWGWVGVGALSDNAH